MTQNPSSRNPAADRLRTRIKAAITGMGRFWNSDDGDTDLLAEAMTELRQRYARDLRDALATEYQRGYEQGFEDENCG